MAKSTISTEAVAQDQIRAFVERIMRMREEAKAIKDDIREIYAEAKGNGFDKTVLGKLVLHIERRAKDNAGMLEAAALFDLYLEAFDGGRGGDEDDGDTGTGNALTHTHEASRAARAKHRLSESMDDNKALSAEMLRDGLISPEAHAENVAMSDGVARKLGAGVINPQTGEIIESDSPKHIVVAQQPDNNSAAPATTPPGAIAADAAGKGSDALPAEQTTESLPVSAQPVDGAQSSPAGAEGDEDRQPIPDNVMQLRPPKPLRPFCNPLPGKPCGGHGKSHCGRCEAAQMPTGQMAIEAGGVTVEHQGLVG